MARLYCLMTSANDTVFPNMVVRTQNRICRRNLSVIKQILKEKEEWTDCVQSDTRAFGIAGDWKGTVLKAEVWVETVTEDGRRFMAAWRKEEVDSARHRQEKREATRLGNYRRRECRILRSHTHWRSRRAEGILVRTRDRPRPA